MRRLVLTLVLGLSWGSSFLWIKYALDSFSPVVITTCRLVLGAATCYVFCLTVGAKMPNKLRIFAVLTGAGTLANALPYALFAVGEQRTSSGIAGLLNSTAPLWTLIIAWLLRDRSASGRSIVGVLIGLAGSALMVMPAIVNAHGELLGVLACLGAAFCYGLSYIYIDRFLAGNQYELPALATVQLATAAVVSVPFAFFVEPRIEHVHAGSLVPLVVLGVLGTGIAYLVNYELIRAAGPVAASVVSYVIPVVAVVLSVAVLSEPLSAWSIVGGAVTLVGVALTRTRKPAAESTVSASQ